MIRLRIDPETVKYYDDGGRARIRCEINGDSYHIWVVPDTLEQDMTVHGYGVLYKNPKEVAGQSHRVRTRHLNTAVDTNARIIAEMIRIVRERGLVEKAKAERAKMLSEQQRLQAEHIRQNRIRDAAQELYSALYVMRALFERKPDGSIEFKDALLDAALTAADNTLKLADEGTPVNTVQPGELTKSANAD